MFKKLLLVTALFLIMASVASAADVFFSCAPIMGTSADPAHKNWSDVVSFEVGRSGTAVTSVTVTKRIDAATPDFASNCGASKNLRDGVLEIMSAGSLVMRIKMSEIAITGIKQKYSRTNDPEPVEELTLSASSIAYENK